MNSDRVIECAIRAAKNLLWQNLPPTHTLPDGATVARVRELVNSPSIQSALQCGSDTFLAFVLREVQFVIADRSLTDRQILARLWDVLDPTRTARIGAHRRNSSPAQLEALSQSRPSRSPPRVTAGKKPRGARQHRASRFGLCFMSAFRFVLSAFPNPRGRAAKLRHPVCVRRRRRRTSTRQPLNAPIA
jgi:hypothetical protein